MAYKKELANKIIAFLKIHLNARNTLAEVINSVDYTELYKNNFAYNLWEEFRPIHQKYLEDISEIFKKYYDEYKSLEWKAFDNMDNDTGRKLDRILDIINTKREKLSEEEVIKFINYFPNDPETTSLICEKLKGLGVHKTLVVKETENSVLGKREMELAYVKEIEEYSKNIYAGNGKLSVPYDVNVNDGLGGLGKWAMLDDDFKYIGGEYQYISPEDTEYGYLYSGK